MNSKVQEMLKLVDKFSNRHHKHEVLSDCFECWAICLSNMVDTPQRDEREKRYLEIVKKYDKCDLDIMAELFALVWITLTQMPENGFADYLGELYMASDTSKAVIRPNAKTFLRWRMMYFSLWDLLAKAEHL